MSEDIKPLLGIGACLTGQPVRYSGDAKKRHEHIDAMQAVFDMRNFCPEMAIGLGVPRKTIRLVGDIESVRLTDSDTQTADHTLAMRDYAAEVLDSHPDMAGYVLVKGSPSCGYERVKRYNEAGKVMGNDSRGLFTQTLMAIDPLLPLEEDGRLFDHAIRENFIVRVYAYHEWKKLLADRGGFHALSKFWSRYKYQVMAHHIPSYKALGRLLGNAKSQPFEDLQAEFAVTFMQALAHIPNRKGHVNVLNHLRGYLKKNLSSSQKRQLDTVIEQYREGIVPLVVPMTLLQHFFNEHQHDYIDQQVFMQPYPEKLSLRNNI